MTINSGVLAYIKAFRQRADIDSIRNHVLGKYSSSLIHSAKDVLWEGCSDDLGRLKLEKTKIVRDLVTAVNSDL